MKKVWKKTWHIIKHLMPFVFMIVFWYLTYYILQGVYSVLGKEPAAHLAALLNYVVAIVLMMLTAVTVGFLFRHRRDGMFTPIIESIRRIGKGDLSAGLTVPEHLQNRPEMKGPFGELIDSINTMAGELTQMEKMRQEFISNVSHEIQSPLTSIGGFARALRNDSLGQAERERYLDIIEKEVGRLSRLSDNLLKLTSLESEHQPVHPKPYRLDRQLRTVILSGEPQWQAKELDVEAELEELTVTADEELLSQVWVNLLHNSIKFTPAGGSIRVSAANRGKTVQISFADSGIGIGEEEREHVFERFYKADRARNREAGGSGLGLAIAKKIIDLHGGRIDVASSPGEGATFTVHLPLETDGVGGRAKPGIT